MSDSNTQFLAFVEVMKQHTVASDDSSVPIVKRNVPVEEQIRTGVSNIIQPKYAIINIYDIEQQVGLVHFSSKEHQFFVIAPYIVFNTNLSKTAGKISLI